MNTIANWSPRPLEALLNFNIVYIHEERIGVIENIGWYHGFLAYTVKVDGATMWLPVPRMWRKEPLMFIGTHVFVNFTFEKIGTLKDLISKTIGGVAY